MSPEIAENGTAPVTIVVPCCNEETRLSRLITRLDAMHANGANSWHVVFVDDGSADGTFATLLSAAHARPWIKLVRHSEPLGAGAALRTGLMHTDSPVVCTLDNEWRYAPEHLKALAAQIAAGADVAVATADEASGDGVDDAVSTATPSHDRQGSRRILGYSLSAFTCQLRAYRRETIGSMRFRSNGHGAATEIFVRALVTRRKVHTEPIAPTAAASNKGRRRPTWSPFLYASLAVLSPLVSVARTMSRLLEKAVL